MGVYWFGLATMAISIGIMFKNKHFSAKSALLLGGMSGVFYLTSRIPGSVNEMLQ